MAAPMLNVPLVLEEKDRQPDGMGGYRVIWRPLGVLHGALRAGPGRLRGGEAGPQSVSLWRITLRAFPVGDPRRPVPGQRLRMGARLFRIDAVTETGTAGRHLIISAQEE